MKKLSLLLLVVLTIASCTNEPKDYVTLSGKITDKSSDSVVVRTRTFSRTIAVNEDGTFSDTLKVEAGFYNFYDGNESTNIYLKNGYDLTITLDTKEFDESIAFTGNGAESNNFLAKKALISEKLLDQNFDRFTKEELNASFETIKSELDGYVNDNKSGIDTAVVNNAYKDTDAMIASYKNYFGNTIDLRAKFYGQPSPTFDNYMNIDGSETSLSDLKGKYVYVDVWATWCGPCKAEIPSLKKVEASYHGKNIAFVSMSIDDDRSHGGSWEKAEENWRAMVTDKELKGIQIFAPKGWQSEFVTGYEIKGIPRFILIGPDGNIIDASAPRPSSESLIKLFDEHNI
ncbi:MAG: TlpA disulfide reductase family protein [Urechidicola sp.]|nr:TlpA disulfide reductase family protein [Urechidicola sp.]